MQFEMCITKVSLFRFAASTMAFQYYHSVSYTLYSRDIVPGELFSFLKMKLKLKNWYFDVVEKMQGNRNKCFMLFRNKDTKKRYNQSNCWDRSATRWNLTSWKSKFVYFL